MYESLLKNAQQQFEARRQLFAQGAIPKKELDDSEKQIAEAQTKIAEARKDAGETKREADYKVAIERCDSLAGERKDLCVKDAKARFGK